MKQTLLERLNIVNRCKTYRGIDKKPTVCHFGGSGRTPNGWATSRHVADEVDSAGQEVDVQAGEPAGFLLRGPATSVKMASENAERREKRENLDKSSRECFPSRDKGVEG